MNLLNKINSGQKKPNLFNGAKNRIFTYTLATMLALTGIFGCGGKKSTSPSSAIPDKIETKNQLTNSKGQVNFTDNSTLEEITLEVVDEYSKSPIRDMEVKYSGGKGYAVFFTDDPSGKYMSSIGIYRPKLASAKIQPHNPTHIIETRKIDGGIYEIYTIGKEDELAQVVWKWKSENPLDFSEYNYERTIDYDEYIEIKDRYCAVVDLMWDVASYLLGANVSIPQPLEEGVEFFLGVELPTSPSEIVEHFCPELENPPQRWDLYTYENVSDVRSFFTMTPSNIPTVSIDNLNIEDDKVNISWKGFDKDVYDIGLVFLPSNKDLTRYLDGNSTSDLTYSYRIIKKGEVYEEYDWAEYNKKTSTTFDIPERGNYSLELRVKDEVDNIGEASVDFLVKRKDISDFEDDFEWVNVPAGSFTMNNGQIKTIDYSYKIMKYEITNEQFVNYLEEALDEESILIGSGGFYIRNDRYVISTLCTEILGYFGNEKQQFVNLETWLPYKQRVHYNQIRCDGEEFSILIGKENHPVNEVTWFGANAFAEHCGLRIPTIEEWVKAARGSTTSNYSWGDEINAGRFNYLNSGDPFETSYVNYPWTTPVGFYNGQNHDGFQTIDSPSPYGAYDMAGNVWEYTSESTSIVLGGGWWDKPYPVGTRYGRTGSILDVGFRCVKD